MMFSTPTVEAAGIIIVTLFILLQHGKKFKPRGQERK